MPRRIAILDTTLRDGEQGPGFSMNLDEKLEVARQLARLGVDVIEAGYPVTSPGDFASVKEIARVVRGPVIASLARAVDEGDRRGLGGRAAAPSGRGSTSSSPTSAIHMEHRLKMGPQASARAGRAPRSAGRGASAPRSSSRPRTRRAPTRTSSAASSRRSIEAGATVVNVPDTVGYAVPEEYAALIRDGARRACPTSSKATLSAHCHDDLGLAVANTLAAIGAGAQQVECTINGLGREGGQRGPRGARHGAGDEGRRPPRLLRRRHDADLRRARSSCRRSRACGPSPTRPSSGTTPSPTSRAATRPASSRTGRPTRS